MDSQASCQSTTTTGKRKLRGRLNLFKCHCCRRDKQKVRHHRLSRDTRCDHPLTSLQCEPVDRVWPQKCNRCEYKGFECSENTRKKRAAVQSNGKPSDNTRAAILTRQESREQDSQDTVNFSDFESLWHVGPTPSPERVLDGAREDILESNSSLLDNVGTDEQASDRALDEELEQM